MDRPEVISPPLQEKKSPFFSSRRGLVLTLAFLTLLCLAGILLFRHFHPEQSRDAVLYIHLIGRWHQEGFAGIIRAWTTFWLPPLYFYLSHLLMCLGLSAESAGLFLSMTCGAALPLVAFGIAFEILQRKDIALGAALLTAVNPNVIELACCVQRDIPYLFFAGLVLYFFIAGIQREKWFFCLLAGVFCAASLFMRFEALEFIPLVVLYGLIALLRKQGKWYGILRNTAIFFAGLFLAIAAFLWCMEDSADMGMMKMYRRYIEGKYSILLQRNKARRGISPEKSAPKKANGTKGSDAGRRQK
ncbi:MAG: glycosyltransferase family 39 protein [Lentisphaeria bacterium]|nr:glycosyltransferase family 39 protein [Lentisphaeria bacterium]